MSINHNPPRQDRRGLGRDPVRKHDGVHSVGTKRPVILDPRNGSPFDAGNYGNAPGANGPSQGE
jgi:hypothetical protein